MKKLIIITLLLSIAISCNRVDDDLSLDSTHTSIEELITSTDTPIDDVLLVDALCNGGWETFAYQDSISSITEVESFVRYLFNVDGTCVALVELNVNTPTAVHGVLPVGTPLYSRKYSWEYDSDNDILITSDEYGNKHSAKILYFDGATLCYEGNICSEMMDKPKSVCRIATLKSDVERWMDGAHPYDTIVRNYIDPNDRRFKRMMELCTSENNIDDQAFIEALLTKSFSYMYDDKNSDSGVSYGDLGIYYIADDGIIYHKGLEVQNYFWAHALVMFEDNTLRECFSQWLFPERGTLCYCEYTWEYDSNTNMLITPLLESQAEVLYFDGDIAILKGSIMGIPNYYADRFKEAYFYVRFDRFNRETLLNEYKPYYKE